MVFRVPLPFSPAGIGRFATAPLRWLLLYQLVVAGFIAVVFAGFARNRWFTQVSMAIRNLPAQAELDRGVLVWRGDSPVQLAGSKFIAIVIDLNQETGLGGEADLCIRLGRTEAQLHSLFGYIPIPYPKAWRIPFDRAWWSAWSDAILLCAGAGFGLAMFIFWAASAGLYAMPVWLVAFMANRKVTFLGALKLASAAQLPGGVLTGFGILLYGQGWLDLVQLGAVLAMQFVVVWFLVLTAPLKLERLDSPEVFRGNPFAPPCPTSPKSEPGENRKQSEQRDAPGHR